MALVLRYAMIPFEYGKGIKYINYIKAYLVLRHVNKKVYMNLQVIDKRTHFVFEIPMPYSVMVKFCSVRDELAHSSYHHKISFVDTFGNPRFYVGDGYMDLKSLKTIKHRCVELSAPLKPAVDLRKFKPMKESEMKKLKRKLDNLRI